MCGIPSIKIWQIVSYLKKNQTLVSSVTISDWHIIIVYENLINKYVTKEETTLNSNES